MLRLLSSTMKRDHIPKLLSFCLVISFCRPAYSAANTSSNSAEFQPETERRFSLEDASESAELKNGHLTAMFRKFESEGTQGEEKGVQSLLPKLVGYFQNALMSPKTADTKARRDSKPDLEDSEDFEEELLEFTENDFAEDAIADEIGFGPKDSHSISYGRNFNETDGNVTSGKREMPIYLFQGQYLAEPRLNRFVDGAMDNLGLEMKTTHLDPMYFSVLPRGRLVGRPNPLRQFPGKVPARRRRRRPVRRRVQRRRRKPLLQALFHGRSLRSSDSDDTGTWRQKRQLVQGQKNQAQQANRQQRKNVQNRAVGAGRVEGLSKVFRDGDAEMQLFGNYTLIRSHYNMGPLHLVMHFKTIRGLRRADSTLEKVRIHTVTRVNMQGCEMVDFLLDRPHAVTIQLRNQLFPMANRVARNIFSRLFASESFLVVRIREKTGLALLSKKTSF